MSELWKRYSTSEVVQMLECESEEEFDGYIDENHDRMKIKWNMR